MQGGDTERSKELMEAILSGTMNFPVEGFPLCLEAMPAEVCRPACLHADAVAAVMFGKR